jgi:hypothetical protein
MIFFESEDSVDAAALDEAHGGELVEGLHQVLVDDQVLRARNLSQLKSKSISTSV